MKPEDHAMASRRQFVGGVAAGLAQRRREKAIQASGKQGFATADPYRGADNPGNRILRQITGGLLSLRRRRAAARPCEQDGTAARSWRKKLPGLWPAGRLKGASHRW